MVQKQAANSIRSHSDEFADDDPLAELARIVGFDQPLKREPVVSLPQAPQMGSAEYNLEDELIREFEGYEASPAPSSYAPAVSPPEPVAPRAPVMESYQPVQVREEPRFEPEPLAFEAAPLPSYEVQPVAYAATALGDVDVSGPGVDLSESARDERQVLAEAQVVQQAEPELSFDLADELEYSMADADVLPAVAAAQQKPVQSEPPRLRLPLANFAAQPVRRAEPELVVEPSRSSFDIQDFDAAPLPEVSVAKAPAVLDFGKASFDWASGPVEPIPAIASPSEPIVPPVQMEYTARTDGPAAAVEQRAPSTPITPVAAPMQMADPSQRDEPDFSFDFLNELALDENVEVAPKAEVSAPARPAPKASEDDFDPFHDQDFDLQLDDIELDLSELDVAPEKPATPAAPVVAAPVFAAAAASVAPVRTQPAMASPSYRPEPFQPSYSSAPSGPATTYQAPIAAPVQSSEPMRPVAPAGDNFGFDPSEISEQDDLVETLIGLDVPDVPIAETRAPQTTQPDYDFDIDAELATLFEEPAAPISRQATPVTASAVAPVAVQAPASASRASSAPIDEFDAFEKALQEDFRSTMRTPGGFEPESRGHIEIAGEGRGFRFRHIKPYLMAGTAVIVLLAGAGGLYAWLGSGAVGTLSGGEPVVIAADDTPVKIVPEDPGGKSVPNQDKAVYDRVAGNGVEDPKQPSLISSEEEPVDVVQRTLIPETVPLEGANDSMATPVGETEDPRLLPEGQSQQAAAEDPATITPRRVRTMIVRPDGTLVAQEVPADPAPAPIQTAAAAPQQAAAEAPVLAAPSVPTANTGDTVQTVDTRVVTPGGPTDAAAPAAPAATSAPTNVAAAAAPADVQTAAQSAAPAAPVDASAPRAPIPTTRPADQPVNVVGTVTDQGNLRPAQSAASAPAPAPAQPAAQTEVAAASPAAAAPAPAASTPSGGFGVQIASLPSEADAQKSYRSLSSKFGNVLAGKPWEIRQADIPGKGTFYRVRIVAESREQAVAICEQYRAAGGSCLVSR
ncbi:SPOR domain-containing protein [Rhizobium sp. AQ_MP]|uniref:SPOR domain-containing protein n=1 Tax=Rhizobium sp. AQ_MP TaxID=2761536 RepID=UPI00163AB20B|nr:SPOR domain-containing protein [Rhizobium sp. AQ_MP]MBC2773904.1 SPOR domain-containing protein [Rhizobium sp. AQ_MP]